MGAGFRIKAANSAAEILIYEDIGADFWGDGVTAKSFAKDLKAAGKVDTIDLRINSYGGDVFDGLAIYSQLQDHPARIVTHIDGIAASIASIIAMAGDEIRIAEAGFLMIHNAWGMAVGNAAELRDVADRLDTVSGSLVDVYVARTGLPRDEVVAMMDGETWLDGSEAVEKGFANSVIKNMRVAAKFDPSRHKFRHAPAGLSAAGIARPNYDARLDRLRQTTTAARVAALKTARVA